MIKRYNIRIKMFNIAWLVFVMNLVSSMQCFAQYNPEEKSDTSTEIIFKYGIGFVEIIVIVVIIYTMCILLITSILFITSGGDEDRIDTAAAWTKRSALSLIIAVIVYMGANMVK